MTAPVTAPADLVDLAVSIIDIEASGFGRHSYPIEIGYVLPDGRAWCTLVRPEAGWTHWDPAAERVHGITPDMLRLHGRPVREVADTLNADLAGRTVYCDGWAHDYTWLNILFEESGRQPAFKLESIVRLLDDSALGRLPDAHRAARRSLGGARHRASADAKALQHALRSVLGTVAAER
jgi:hypothetical protein